RRCSPSTTSLLSIGSICAHRIRSRAPSRRSATGPSAPRAVSPEPPRWPWCSSSSKLHRRAGDDSMDTNSCRRSCSGPSSPTGSRSLLSILSQKPPPESRPLSPRFAHSSIQRETLRLIQSTLKGTRLCKDVLVVLPTEHLLRGFVFERTLHKETYCLWRVIT